MITLPEGQVPRFRRLSGDDVLVSGVRDTSWTFELLDREEVPIGELVGVEKGEVSYTANASIKGSGTLTLTDLTQALEGKGIDWMNVRVRPKVTIEGMARPLPEGIWTVSAPNETWNDQGRVWEVDLLDKLSILDDDVWVHYITGEPTSFTAHKGTNALRHVMWIIRQTGEKTPMIHEWLDPDAIMGSTMTWEPGTTRLRMINDLLDHIGYFSLYTDRYGRYRAEKYTRPQTRPPAYEALGAFEAGPSSIMSPDYTLERDLYATPNRVIARQQSTEDEPGLVAMATNTNPDSPYSYQSRGRWITAVEEEVEVNSQATLDAYAQQRLQTMTSTAAALSLDHLYMPDVAINSTVRVVNPRSSMNLLTTVSKITIPMDDVGLCTSELREVADI